MIINSLIQIILKIDLFMLFQIIYTFKHFSMYLNNVIVNYLDLIII